MEHPHSRLLRVELTGDLALGGYFVMAHWPDPDTAPELESANGPLTLVFDTVGRGLGDLRRTLLKVHPRNDALSKSVQAWSEELDRRGLADVGAPIGLPIDPPRAPRAG